MKKWLGNSMVFKVFVYAFLLLFLTSLISVMPSSVANAASKYTVEIQKSNGLAAKKQGSTFWNDIYSKLSGEHGVKWCDSKNKISMGTELRGGNKDLRDYFPAYCSDDKNVWQCSTIDIKSKTNNGTNPGDEKNTSTREHTVKVSCDENSNRMTVAEYEESKKGNAAVEEQKKKDAIGKATNEEECKAAGGYWDTWARCQAEPIDNGSTEEDSSGDGGDTESSTCEQNMEGFGWIFCPGMNLARGAVDGIYMAIGNLLQWSFLADNGDSIRDVWQNFLNIANVVFAIVFLVMIYSMATSTGLSNYDIKKILPRLIIVAILVNLSFYVCAAIVDLFNIIGRGIYSLISGSVDLTPRDPLEAIGNAVANVATFLTAVAAAVILICCFLGTALVAVILVFVCLVFRQLALTVLVVISPVAFALYMLPNTEKWFRKWLDMFVRLLAVFPMFMALWGASQLVSAISIKAGGASLINFVVGCLSLIAPAVGIVPLFKMSGGLLGMAMGAASGALAKTGVNKKLNKKGRDVAVKPFSAAAYHAGNLLRSRGGRWGNAIASTPSFRNASTKHEQTLMENRGKAIKDAGTWLDGRNLSQDQLKSIATSSQYTDANGNTIRVTDPYIISSAIEKSKDNLSADDIQQTMQNVDNVTSSMNAGDSAYIRGQVGTSLGGAKKIGISAGAVGDWTSGKFAGNFASSYANAAGSKGASLSASAMSSTNKDTLSHMFNNANAEQKAAMAQTASSVLGSNKLMQSVNSETRDVLEKIAGTDKASQLQRDTMRKIHDNMANANMMNEAGAATRIGNPLRGSDTSNLVQPNDVAGQQLLNQINAGKSSQRDLGTQALINAKSKQNTYTTTSRDAAIDQAVNQVMDGINRDVYGRK